MTGRDVMRRLQIAPMDAIVQYCHAHAPEADQLMAIGYATFTANVQKAMDIWTAEKPGNQKSSEVEFSSDSAEAREMLAMLNDLGNKVVDSVKQYDPQKYCPGLAQRLDATSPEAILKSLHQYEARVAARVAGMKNAK